MVVLRMPNGAKKNCVCRGADFASYLRQRFAVTIDRGGADVRFGEFEIMIVLGGNDLENTTGFTQHLRSDAVTGQICNSRSHV